MLGVQVMAKDEYKVEAYDCSQPMNIKMFDREAHCRFNPEVVGVPEKVTILQHVSTQTVEGYKCQVSSHRTLQKVHIDFSRAINMMCNLSHFL